MNPIFVDFQYDLGRITKLLDLTRSVDGLQKQIVNYESAERPEYRSSLEELHRSIATAHTEMPILNGVLLLYLAGRFENFVREIFEDLCDSLARKHGAFSDLPKEMRRNLVAYTAEVISSPRKYGHADNGVAGFVAVLSENLAGQALTRVNSKCLSITSENMRPDVLNDIFNRIGAQKIWEKIGQQLSIQTFFQVDVADRATLDARSMLNDLMERRNKIAHPSGNIAWPSDPELRKWIRFCELVGECITAACAVWAGSL